MAISRTAMNLPAPKWYRITKKMVELVTNLTITVMMIVGHRADDIILLIIKVAQSFVMDTLDTFMSNNEVYADISQVKPSELEPVVEVKPVEKVPIAKFPDSSSIPHDETK